MTQQQGNARALDLGGRGVVGLAGARNAARRVAAWALYALLATVTTSHAAIIGIQGNGSVFSINEGTGASTLLSNNPAFAANSMAKNSAGTLYTAGGLGNSLLNTINPATGVLTIGVLISGNDDVRGLAFSPGNVLYATSATAGGASLYTIDVATGVVTLISAVGTMQGLEFSASGLLYGWSATLGLVTIDPATGAVTDVNPSVGSTVSIQTIAFSAGGVAYGGSQTDLYTIDLATGVLTLIGSLAPITDLRGMQFDAAPPPVPGVSLAPASLVFGAQQVGTTSLPQAITLQNIGGAVLDIASIIASGDFARTSTCGATLAPAATCAINVTFTPSVVGARTGSIVLTSNAPGSPHSVPLTGTGSAIPPPPAVVLTPATLAFGSQILGSTSAAQLLTLQNAGGTTLNIASITATGDFAQSNNCGATLPALASCTISVSFSPTALGARVGAVNVASDAPGSPQAAPLNGIGIGAPPPPAASAPIPTVSEWGLMLLALLVGIVAIADRRLRARRH